MLTRDEVEAIVRRALEPLEAEVRNLREAIETQEEPATLAQVEEALLPVLASVGALPRPRRKAARRRTKTPAKRSR